MPVSKPTQGQSCVVRKAGREREEVLDEPASAHARGGTMGGRTPSPTSSTPGRRKEADRCVIEAVSAVLGIRAGIDLGVGGPW